MTLGDTDAVKVLTDTIVKAIDMKIKSSETKIKKQITKVVEANISASTSGGAAQTDAVTSEELESRLAGKVDAVDGKGLSTNDYTDAEKSKLSGIAAGANNYIHPTHNPVVSGLYKITVDENGHVSAVTGVAKTDITALGIPAQDTTYGTVTTGAAGLMSAADKIKLNGVASGANAYTHPSYTSIASGLYKLTVDATGHVSAASAVTKADITALGIPAQDTNTTYMDATDSVSGLMSASDKAKLDGVSANANAYTLPVAGASLGGVKSGTDIMVDGSGNVSVNDDSHNHVIGNVDGLQTALNSKSGTEHDHDDRYYTESEMSTLLDAKLNTSLKGAASGLAELDENGKVLSSQLPSYVDDVIESANVSAFPVTGETGKIYIAQDSNKTYRWAGTAYVEISASLALGETSSTAYRGDRGKTAYDHSQATHAPITDATTSAHGLMSTNDKIKLDGIASGANAYSHPAYTEHSSGLYKLTVDASGHVSAATPVNKDDITELGIPAQDTTYSHPAYASKSNGLYKLTVDATGHVSAVDPVIKSDITNLGIPAQDTTYSVATTSADGLMSATDKTKLDGIQAGAGAPYTHPNSGATAGTYNNVTVNEQGHVTGGSNVSYAAGTHMHNDGLDVIGSATNTYIVYPSGGRVRAQTSKYTGYLKITLPVAWSRSMLRFTVDFYNYQTNTSASYTVGGYNHSSGTWSNGPFAYSVGCQGGKLSNLTVRLGHDGTKCAVYIGETSTNWNYTQVTIKDITVGFSGYAFANWASGWAVGWTTTLGTITATIENPFVAYSPVYTVTLSTSWSGSGPYTQTVSVPGILATDSPIVDVVQSTTTATAQAQLEAWGCVSRIDTAANSITAYCYDDKPTVAIPIQLKVVR